jgi:hypothetical protein
VTTGGREEASGERAEVARFFGNGGGGDGVRGSSSGEEGSLSSPWETWRAFSCNERVAMAAALLVSSVLL